MGSTRPGELQLLVASEPEWFPLDLLARYRGKLLGARVDSAGAVVYNGQSYESPSAAAAAARRQNGYDGLGSFDEWLGFLALRRR